MDVFDGRSQSSKRISALVDDLPHQLQNTIQSRLRWRVFGQPVYRNMQLHRRTEHALQQGIVQLLCDPRTLGKPLLKAEIHFPGHLMKPEAVHPEDHYCADDHA